MSYLYDCANRRWLTLPLDLPITVSFPILHLFARFAIGFVEWGALDDMLKVTQKSPEPRCSPCALPPMQMTESQAQEMLAAMVRTDSSMCSSTVSSPTLDQGRRAANRVRAMLKKTFLVARFDGAVGGLGTSELERWGPSSKDVNHPSYLGGLRHDIEVVVFEFLETASDAVISGSFQQTLGKHVEQCYTRLRAWMEGGQCSSEIGTATVYSVMTSLKWKSVSGAVAYYLLHECVAAHLEHSLDVCRTELLMDVPLYDEEPRVYGLIDLAFAAVADDFCVGIRASDMASQLRYWCGGPSCAE
jgi:hypothetical protein